jgi:hypothetical protein
MNRWQDQPRDAHERITIRTIWLTLALSILIHLAALFVWLPHTPVLASLEPDVGEASAPVQVQLTPQASSIPTPPPSPPPSAAPEPPRETQATVKPPKVAIRPPPRQTIVAPSPQAPAVPPPPPTPAPEPTQPSPPVAATTPSPPVTGDLASFIEARRRARGETPSDDKEAYNRSIAANLPRAATGSASSDSNHSGGIFAIKRMAYDDAVFEFYGWNKEVRQRTPQIFEVRKGNNPDMRIAVVRRMIVIIREFEKEDFVWESHRLGRNVTLSARQADNAALEQFMMQEFERDFANTP